MERKDSILKGIFVVIGVVVSISAVIAVLYHIFTKFFKISLECDCDNCDAEDCDGCENCDDCSFEDCDIFGKDPDAEPVE